MSFHHRMMLQRYGLGHTTSLYSQVAFDPIFTPLFSAVLGSFGATTIVGGITVAQVASAIATTALSIGLQALLAPTPPKPEDGKIPKMQAVPHRWWGVGRNRTAGAYMLWDASGSRLCAVQALRGHKIKSVNRYWLHDDEVTIDGDGFVQGIGQRYGNDRVRIMHRLGNVPETAYGPIVDIFGADGIWTNNHRGDGQASVGMIAINSQETKQQKRFPFGPPQLSVETDDALCWDFRDPLQDPEDPDTWQWTRNAAVIMAWHQCFNEFGHKRDYRRAILPVLDMWQEEADVCDELVPLAGGGFERRYECNGFDTTENDPKAATNAILAACDGWICERGDGALLFTVGKFRESRVATLTDADLVGHRIEYDVLFEDEINRLIPKFTYPAVGYSTSDTDFFEDTDAQLIAGRVLAQEANYQWVHQWRQARRLGIRDWRRIQQKVSGSLDVRLSGINAVYARWVRLATPLSIPRLDGKVVENRKSVLALLNGGFSMDIMLHPENIDAWNPATDEGQHPPVPPKTNAKDVLTPVINLVQARANGGAVYIRVVIIDPEDESLTPVVRYRVADNGSGNPGAWIEQRFDDAVPAGGYIDLATQTVPVDQTIEVQVGFIASDGDRGEWSATETVISTADPVAPIALTSFSQTAAAPHFGNAVFAIVTSNDSHLRTVKLYRKATGVPLNIAVDTPIVSLAAAPSATYSYTDGDATRTNLVTNGDFASSAGWTLPANVTISGGTANKAAAATTQDLLRSISTVASGKTVRGKMDITAWTSGTVRAMFRDLASGLSNGSATFNTVGEHMFAVDLSASRDIAIARFDAASVGSIDNFFAYEETAGCAPQGTWDYYAVPFNGSDIAGPTSGPVTVTII